MARSLFPIGFIFVCTAFAWMLLGSTLVQRTNDSDTAQTQDLASQWGGPQVQAAPRVTGWEGTPLGGRVATIPIRSSRIAVDLALEQRRKGLLWYNLYDVHFSAHYGVRNTTRTRHLMLHFSLPSTSATYANFLVTVAGHPIDQAASNEYWAAFDLAPGAQTQLDVTYQSRGVGSWTYRFGNGVNAVNDFDLSMTTNFEAIDFPSQTLLPVAERRTGNGWQLDWRYATLLTGNGIGMAFPSPLQPGPLAQRLTFWAPVALLFYFFRDARGHEAARYRLTPPQLLLSRLCVLRVSPIVRVPGRPDRGRGGICNLFARLDVPDDIVPSAGRRLAFRRGRKRPSPADLPGVVLVRAV